MNAIKGNLGQAFPVASLEASLEITGRLGNNYSDKFTGIKSVIRIKFKYAIQIQL